MLGQGKLADALDSNPRLGPEILKRLYSAAQKSEGKSIIAAILLAAGGKIEISIEHAAIAIDGDYVLYAEESRTPDGTPSMLLLAKPKPKCDHCKQVIKDAPPWL